SRGKIQLHLETCDLARIVGETVADYRPGLENRGLRLTVEVPGQPLWVRGDPTRLAQIVGNLLHNASKFTDVGGAVTVRAAEVSEDGTTLLTIRDTGIGMEAGILTRAFEAFSQGDRSKDRNRGGLGLGLALVKGLVEVHGGAVAAASEGPG